MKHMTMMSFSIVSGWYTSVGRHAWCGGCTHTEWRTPKLDPNEQLKASVKNTRGNW